MYTSCNGFKVRLIINDVSSSNKAFFGPFENVCSEKYNKIITYVNIIERNNSILNFFNFKLFYCKHNKCIFIFSQNVNHEQLI